MKFIEDGLHPFLIVITALDINVVCAVMVVVVAVGRVVIGVVLVVVVGVVVVLNDPKLGSPPVQSTTDCVEMICIFTKWSLS